jgi:hypothetical protein
MTHALTKSREVHLSNGQFDGAEKLLRTLALRRSNETAERADPKLKQARLGNVIVKVVDSSQLLGRDHPNPLMSV